MTSFLRTIQQTETPLSRMFFSELNMNTLQRTIRQEFKDKTGIAIDYQDSTQLMVLMRAVYITGAVNPWVPGNQLDRMNSQVVKQALSQINTGVTGYINYMKNVNTVSLPMSLPMNTSTYGKKMGFVRP